MNDAKKNHQIFEIAYVWEVVKMIPLIAAAAYLIGYVVNQSYLGSLGIPSVRIINTAFFKSGILVLAIFLPVIYSVYVEFDDPTDDFAKSIRYIPIIVNHSISIAVAITYVVIFSGVGDFRLFLTAGWFSKALPPIIMIDLLLHMYATSYAGKGMSSRARSLFLILPAAAMYVCALLAGPPASRALLKLLGITSVITFLLLGLYGDRKLSTAGPLVTIIIFFLGCSVFGQQVYPAIPGHLGGTRPYAATLTVKAEYATAMTQMGFVVTQSLQIERATIAYDDADTYVLVNDKGSHAISKQVFIAISSSK
jgi:hypothetical protein